MRPYHSDAWFRVKPGDRVKLADGSFARVHTSRHRRDESGLHIDVVAVKEDSVERISINVNIGKAQR